MSFSAIPRPSSSPRGHGVQRGTQSAITSVISTTLIWPKAKFDVIGSSQIDAAAVGLHAHLDVVVDDAFHRDENLHCGTNPLLRNNIPGLAAWAQEMPSGGTRLPPFLHLHNRNVTGGSQRWERYRPPRLLSRYLLAPGRHSTSFLPLAYITTDWVRPVSPSVTRWYMSTTTPPWRMGEDVVR